MPHALKMTKVVLFISILVPTFPLTHWRNFKIRVFCGLRRKKQVATTAATTAAATTTTATAAAATAATAAAGGPRRFLNGQILDS